MSDVESYTKDLLYDEDWLEGFDYDDDILEEFEKIKNFDDNIKKIKSFHNFVLKYRKGNFFSPMIHAMTSEDPRKEGALEI